MDGALERGGGKRTLSRVLEFLPDTGLFACFLAALRKDTLGRQLLGWMETDAGAFALRRIALSGPGREFNGPAARALFSERIDEIRELLGDPKDVVFRRGILLGAGDEVRRGVSGDALRPAKLVRK
jgi:hypothetical protein